MVKGKWILAAILLAGGAWRAGCQTTVGGSQVNLGGLAADRPVNCAAGQIWLASDTGVLSYCAASGSPGTWRTLTTGGGSGATGLCNVALSATPVFDATSCGVFTLTLGATTVTSSTLVNADAGQALTFIISQDATGGRTFIWPTNVAHVCAVSSSPGVSTIVSAIYDGTSANAIDCTTTDTATLIAGPTRIAPAAPSSGLSCWFDALVGGGGALKCKDTSGNVRAAVLTASSATAQQYVTYINADGVPQTAVVTDQVLSLSDVATNNASTTKHGFLPKLPGDNSKCLLGDGTFGACGSGSSGGSGSGSGFTMSGAGVYSPFQGMTSVPPYGSGDYFQSTGSNGSMECYQWTAPFGIKLGDLFTVTGGGGTASDVFALAVYQDSGSNAVSSKVSGSDVVIVGNTAVQYSEVPWGSTHPTLAAGVYWMCSSNSNSGAMWRVEPTWGSGYAGAIPGHLTSPRRVKCSNSVTYSGPSTTLPSSCGTATAVMSNSNPPYIVIAQ